MKAALAVLFLLTVLWLPGCAQNGYRPINPKEYPGIHQMFDVTFGWKKTVTDNAMTIDGYVRNNRYFIISDMDMAVSLVNGGGKEKARADFIFVPHRLPMDDMSGFSVILKARPEPGDSIRFLYHYNGLDGKDGAFDWRNSFDVPAVE